MTTATATKTAARRRMAQAALIAEGLRRADTTDAYQIRFRCPACNHTQTAADLPPERAEHVAQACFGCGALAEEMTGEHRAALIRVTLPGDVKTDSFPLADELDEDEAPSGPQSAAQETAATPGPLRADIASAPVPVPASEYLTGETDVESEAC